MMEKFKKMLKEKAQQGKFISDEDKSARQEILDEIKSMMGDSMGGDLKKLKDLKKVTVASDSAEGLKAGLEKAEDVVEEKMDGEDSEEEEMPEVSDSEEVPSESEISDKEKIAKLEEELAALKAKQA